MIIQCPHCGVTVAVNGLGLKTCGIPFKNVLNALRDSRTVREAVENLRQEFGNGSASIMESCSCSVSISSDVASSRISEGSIQILSVASCATAREASGTSKSSGDWL